MQKRKQGVYAKYIKRFFDICKFRTMTEAMN